MQLPANGWVVFQKYSFEKLRVFSVCNCSLFDNFSISALQIETICGSKIRKKNFLPLTELWMVAMRSTVFSYQIIIFVFPITNWEQAKVLPEFWDNFFAYIPGTFSRSGQQIVRIALRILPVVLQMQLQTNGISPCQQSCLLLQKEISIIYDIPAQLMPRKDSKSSYYWLSMMWPSFLPLMLWLKLTDELYGWP